MTSLGLGATSSLTISTTTGASTTTIPGGGYFLISNGPSATSSILNSVTIQMATDTVNLLDSYLLNGAIVLKDNLGIIIDETPASTTTAWPAGAIGQATSSMARDWTPGLGTTTANWHTSVIAANWDANVPDKGTPGSYNGYLVSGTFSQLNGTATGTAYLLPSIHGTSTATATASFTSFGAYKAHFFQALYSFSAFRDTDSNGALNATSDPARTLNNSGPGYNLASSGLSAVDFALGLNPSISSLSTTTGYIGETITITGVNFGDSTTTATGQVFIPPYINALNNITSWSSTSIAVRIPVATQTANPMTGTLTVQVGWTVQATTSLTIRPAVTSAAATTKSVTINFDSFIDGSQASIGANYTLQSPIGTNIPLTSAWTEFRGNRASLKGFPSLTAGNTFQISVGANIRSMANTSFGTASSSATGTVTSAPTVTLVSPNSGTAGATTTITGTLFGAATGTLFFSSGMPMGGSPPPPPVQATLNSWSNTSIVAVIPALAKTGPIFVRTNAGIESDFSQSAFFNTLGNANFRILEENTNTPIATNTARLVIGSMAGPQLYYVGDSNSTSYGTNGTTTIPNLSSMGFGWAFDASGLHVSSRGQQLNTAAVTTFTLATSVARITGVITNATANRLLAVFVNPIGGTGEFKEPIFVQVNANGTTSYTVGLAATGTYSIGIDDPGFGSTASSSPKIAPSMVQVNASTTATSTVNFAFASATNRIHGKVEKGGGTGFGVGPGIEAFRVWAYQPVANGLFASAMLNASGEFDLYVNAGTYIVSVGGPDLPAPVEKMVEVKLSDTNFALTNATTDVTLIMKAPSEYIAGTVTDSSGNAISGASVFAWKSGSPGGGQAFTNSSGAYKLYVAAGTYTVEGFAPQYGKLTARNGITVASNSSTTVDFGISSDMATISGGVTKDSASSTDIEIWVTAGDAGYGINRTRTASNGQYSIQVPYGSGYYIHAAQLGKGEIYKASLPTFSSSVTTSTVNIAINMATINVRISPASAFSSAFVEIRNSTSSNERGFSDQNVSTSTTYKEYSISVPKPADTNNASWTYSVQGGIPGFGPLTATSTIVSSSTQSTTITHVLGSIWQISGTIADPDSSTAANEAESAFVWAANSAGHGGGLVTASGTFSFAIKQGTYDFGVDKKNYTGNILSNQAITADASITGLILTSASLAIGGTVSVSGTAESGAWVWGSNGAGGWVGDETDGNGIYSLSVTSGTWQISSVSEGYNSTPQSVSITSGTTTLNISLSAVSGYTSATPTVGAITPLTGGTVKSDNVTVDAPSGALDSQDSNTGRMTIQKTTSIPKTNGVKALGSAAYDISMANSSGTAITVLNSSITISLTYSAADLLSAGISQATAAGLNLGYWDSTANTWTTISTNAATTSDGGVTYTGTTAHLSSYAPLVSSGATPPPTPTGLTASAGESLINLSWSASSGATKYDIYRYRASTNDWPYLAQTTNTAYTNTSLTNGTTYYYKVSALNADDDESTSTDAVSTAPVASAGPAAGSSYSYVPPSTTPATPQTATGQVTATAASGGKTTLTVGENIKAAVELPANAVP
ncbi:MAG: carboxypeptidase regulatory-like domain-containing protein, partial [Candidatus Azambacteria bacterium]|nr:carboxypeptidase regulatory-like domain-containing protein [Candidatus Azambacteria bacterium]